MWLFARAVVWWSLAVVVLWGACGSASDPPISVIPAPAELSIDDGTLELTRDVRIVASAGTEPTAELLAPILRRSTGFAVPVAAGTAGRAGDIVLVLDAGRAELGEEGYELVVADQVTIRAASPAGVFYGCQTLRQLLPPAIERRGLVADASWPIPRVTITDHPRFAWRGFMLDVARHFFGVDEVLRYIDLIASYKLNRLHLHLTDDQGWRIAIASRPLLTEVGAQTQVGGGPGGYFTREDYATIVDYAAARFVTVVPEIDLPGHTNAALASYAELNESGQATQPYTATSGGFSSLWLTDPGALAFATDVLTEIAAMTPGPYVHIGGDEAYATAPEQYAAFIAELQVILRDRGKTMIGWEEVTKANVTPGFVGQFWLAEARASEIVAKGGRVIVSPATHAYLDMQYDFETPAGQSWAGFTNVEKAYAWDPVPVGLGEADVLGVEAPLWTEFVTTPAEIDLMVFPRLPGHAEIGWSPAAPRTWDEYRERLARHGERLDAMGVGYYRATNVDWPR